jgi:hypothetical protein|tara:strand:- start:225 stop:416 length:192 start_codon:yes stop_codon:yes gene_type:complete
MEQSYTCDKCDSGLFTLVDVANYVKLHPESLRRKVRDKQIEGTQLTGIYFTKQQVENILKEKK